MANQQLLLLRSLEHLTTAPSYRPKRQGRPIPLQPIVAQFSQRPIRRPRIQRTALLAPTSLRSRPLGQKRIVRPQPGAQKPEEKKQKDEQPKKDEKPPQ